jgi:hypothetical protein
VVLFKRLPVDEKVAVLDSASKVTVPVTGVTKGPVTVKVPGAVIVAPLIGILNVAVTFLLIATPVVALAGVTDVTVGATSGAGGAATPPRSLSHPAVKTTRSNAINHIILLNALK